MEALGRGATNLAPKLVPLLVRACAADAAGAGAAADADYWQAAYYSLKAFEKLAMLQPILLTRAASEPLWCARRAFPAPCQLVWATGRSGAVR